MLYFKTIRKFPIHRVFFMLLAVLLTQTTYAATSTLNVTLANGITSEAVANLRIDAYERLADGDKKWRAKSTSDSHGAAAFELEGLGEGQVYVLRSKPYNGISAYSEDIDSDADVTFNVGTLQLTLVDHLSQETLANTNVNLYKRLADGSDKSAGSGKTDELGMIRFTPFGLENGETYRVRTSSYGAGYAYSPDVSSISELSLNVGTLQVKVQDFFSQTALADTKVYLYKHEADGSSKRTASGTTDADGLIRFTPLGLEQGQAYYVKSKPYAADYAYSNDISTTGEVTLNAGTLSVTFKDFSNDTPLENLRTYLYKREADDSAKQIANAYTDANGTVRFSPVGLEEGQAYFVKAKPYGADYASTKDITTPSEVVVKAGTLAVTVMDVSSNTALAETKVYLYRREADASSKRIASATTDANGLVRFSPFGIEEGQAYFVKSKPYATDYAYSQNMTAAGELRLNTGTFLATLSDFKSGNIIASTRVDLYERLTDGKSKWRARGNTDAQGVIRFSPTDLDAGRSYFLRTGSFGAGYAYTPDVSATTAMTLKVGTLNVSLTDFIKQSPLAETKVYLYKRNADGSSTSVTNALSDANGLLRFTPLGIETGRSYFLKTKPYSTGYAESVDLNAAGDFAFTVGTLQVKLQNYIDKSVLADLKVSLYERLADGSNKWRANGNTDAEGLIRFTPFGMDAGRRYYVTSKPYDAGYVNSADIIEAQNLVLEVGSNPVTLINGDNGQALTGQRITAYKKLATGILEWNKRATTDDAGVIHFDLDYTAGDSYVFKVQDVFGANKKYYTGVVSEKGAVSFVVTKDGDNTVDLTPPTINISTPADGSNVTNLGFQVSGIAADNKQIDKVSLSVNDPIKGVSQLSATYDAASKIWLANVTESMLTLGENISLTATAVDLAKNQQTVTISLNVTADNDAPDITITSHSENDEVAITGFLLSGLVTDLTQVETLTGSVSTTLSGAATSSVLINDQSLDFSQNGNWTLALNNGLMTVDALLEVTLTATDTIGNTASTAIQLQVIAVDTSELQMINRITFGATPSLLEDVKAIGATAFLNQQLNPSSLDNSVFDAMIASSPTSKVELQAWTLMHMIYSERQLQEVMTWFWDNHFNTSINTTRLNSEGVGLSNTVAYELAENVAFRANALGSFRTLLGISAKSPAMLIYLDAISNVSGDSNENYAREVMELNTMGVGAGYTDEDVEAVAEIFTGWHVHSQGGGFIFHESEHTVGSYTLFSTMGDGVTDESVFIPEGGVSQGDLLLDALAEHRATAEFICSKLITLLVSDTPTGTLLPQCAAEFQASSVQSDQIKRVLTVILQSAEFNFPENYRNKIKTPVEFVVGAVRNIEASTTASDLLSPMKAMGISLYENPVPTGWSEIGADWINTGFLSERMKWVNKFARTASNGTNTASDPMVFYPKYGFETQVGVVGFLMQLTVGDDFTDLSQGNALGILGDSFDLTSPNASEQLRQLSGSVMSYPQYQFQ